MAKKTKTPNHLHALFREYMKARGMTSADLGAKVGCDASTVRKWINRPADAWNMGRFLDYCIALNIPIDEAFAAATKK